MVISRAQIQKELVPGLNALFGLEYATYENEHAEIYKTYSSKKNFEEETKLAGFGQAEVKSEGGEVHFDDAGEVWTARYNHETIAMGFVLTEEAVEDNLYASLSARYTKALARSMAYTKQVKAVTPLNDGFSAYLSGDGVSLFNTAHPTRSGRTNSNTQTTPVDVSETALENAVIQIAGWVDERGLLINAKPMKIIAPVGLQFSLTRILGSELRSGVADNDINAMRKMSSIRQGFRINNFLTDPDSYYIITDIPEGMKHFQRTPLATGDEGDFTTGNMRYKARERYSFGVTDPLGIWGAPGA
jgi:hypothetical protein